MGRTTRTTSTDWRRTSRYALSRPAGEQGSADAGEPAAQPLGAAGDSGPRCVVLGDDVEHRLPSASRSTGSVDGSARPGRAARPGSSADGCPREVATQVLQSNGGQLAALLLGVLQRVPLACAGLLALRRRRETAGPAPDIDVAEPGAERSSARLLSHEIRTPLTLVKGAADLLAEE